MADVVTITTIGALIHTGKGQLVGMVITASTGNPLTTFYDNTASTGTKLFEVYTSASHPTMIFFPDKFALRFSTGCYIAMAANQSATIWTRQI
jgi:hypothetical protein